MTIRDRNTVGIIGGGVSGVSAAIHLRAAGLNVTIFERSSCFGGVWVFDKRLPPEPAYPSEVPSLSDFTALNDQESWRKITGSDKIVDEEVWHAPPGPCYEYLSNNVPTDLMELKTNAWKPDTDAFVNHKVLKEYIQDTASRHSLEERTLFNTRVEHIEKHGSKWHVQTSTATRKSEEKFSKITNYWEFDQLIVATGHYHACRIPSTPGLKELKTQLPSSIQHSKSYRSPVSLKDKTVLIMGASTSSMDIAKELGPIAKKVYQTSRGGSFDLPASWLPANASRVGDIASFSKSKLSSSSSTTSPPLLTATLKDGTILPDLEHIILATGYHMTFPFLQNLHSDSTPASAANSTVLVTDGTQMHNLHLDIFYIPDPTLAFIGVPYHVATFSLFEYQAIAVAAAFAGQVSLPSQEAMQVIYEEKLRRKGAGKAFHSLKPSKDGVSGELVDEEVRYVQVLVDWVNSGKGEGDEKVLPHSEEWKIGKKKLIERIRG